MIPVSMRAETLEKLHAGHLGMEKTSARAREILFWPGLTKQICDMIRTCDVCQERMMKNQKEPLMSHEIPTAPWEVVGTDLLDFDGHKYIVIVDYYSRFFEVEKLSTQSSSSVIHKMKHTFSRHGIPLKVVSDNGPQYASDEFRQFADAWGFHHVTSSPLYPQSNGLAEKTVQTVKRLLEKAKASGEDPYLAILEYRNSPVDHHVSPAQMLMSRMLRSTVPMTPAQRQPKVVPQQDVLYHRRKEQSVQQKYYDRGSKPMSTMKAGDPVRMQWNDRWRPAIVTERVGDRSYNVRALDAYGGEYRRNRVHLRERVPSPPREHVPPVPVTVPVQIPMQMHATPVKDTPMVATPRKTVPVPQQPVSTPVTSQRLDAPSPDSKTVVTRSGRHVIPVVHKDFVKY